jgi:HSP20 family protein
MVLIKSKPESAFNSHFFPGSLNSVFNTFFEDAGVKSNVNFFPQADIIEKGDKFEIRLALPGIKKEDVKIALEGDMLNIEGERKSEINEEKEKFVRREFSYGKFSRSFNVSNLDKSSIEAAFEHGILTVSIAKSKVEKNNIIEIK